MEKAPDARECDPMYENGSTIDDGHLFHTSFNFTQPYLAYSIVDMHQNYFLGYSRSSASHGEVGFFILQFLHVVFYLLKVRVYY